VVASGTTGGRGWREALAVGKTIVVLHFAIVVWLLHRGRRIRGLVEGGLVVVGGGAEALIVGRAVLRITWVTAEREVERVLFAVHAGQCIDSDRESDGGRRGDYLLRAATVVLSCSRVKNSTAALLTVW
jgi:hypothetical protein